MTARYHDHYQTLMSTPLGLVLYSSLCSVFSLHFTSFILKRLAAMFSSRVQLLSWRLILVASALPWYYLQMRLCISYSFFFIWHINICKSWECILPASWRKDHSSSSSWLFQYLLFTDRYKEFMDGSILRERLLLLQSIPVIKVKFG